MAKRFENKVVVVTGAASGMGKSHAEAFAEEGAAVYLTDLNGEAGRSVAREIGGQARFLDHDVVNEDDWATVMDTVKRDHGRLDVLVHNAGFGSPATFDETDSATFNRMIELNLTAAFYGMKSAIELLRAAPSAAVVLTSSTAAKAATPIMFSYGPAKAGVCQMVRSWAVALAPEGIRVNAVLPGIIDTPMSRAATSDPAILNFILSRAPLGRVGQPREVTEAVLFLASDAASFITGVDLPVDGGMLSA
jgi:NAD(P)-dependent dehydrogenase (short-subunit alcohol dehydrogenase family)